MNYHVLINQDEDGVFVVEVPELPGCITQGKTKEEALANAKEAIAAYLESLREHNEQPATSESAHDLEVAEVLEDNALVRAIEEGMQGSVVSRAEVFKVIVDGQ